MVQRGGFTLIAGGCVSLCSFGNFGLLGLVGYGGFYFLIFGKCVLRDM